MVEKNNNWSRFDLPDQKNYPVDPEKVWGSDFKHLEIIGQGSGLGFDFVGLNLPKEWEKSLNQIKLISFDKINSFFSTICQTNNCSLESLVLDSNNILQEIIIKNKNSNNQSRVSLPDPFSFKSETGIYQVENVKDYSSAFVIQNLVSRYLDFCFPQNDYSRIEGYNGFGPINLKIPEKYFESKKPIINEYFKEQFIFKANNICGRFGVELEYLSFKENGILRSCSVTGDRTCFYLENGGSRENREFNSHNVDTYQQAFALHTVVSSYLNHLIDKEKYQQK